MAATPADGAPPADISVVATAAAIPAGAAFLYRDSAEYLFAAFFALAILTIVTPARTLHTLLPWGRIALLPLATCQDLFLLAAIAWLFDGLFATVYPDHDWPSLTQLAPALSIHGLPAVLSRKGYRTAFIPSGQLAIEA